MNSCINCKKNTLSKIVKLGSQPLSGVFLKKKYNNLKKYTLDLYMCNFCKLVQMKKSVKTEDMFGDTYEYKTSLSKLMVDHIFEKVKYINKKKFLRKNSKILDIGCNDGTFLNFFSKNKYDLFGADPSAKKFKHNYNKKIKILNDFFTKEKINNQFGTLNFDLITSFAMFYDVNEPNKFCKDISDLLTKNGLWILELSYLPLMLKNLTYDQICHEHVAYYSLSTFKKIAEKNGLKIIDYTLNEINGGSIEIICSKKTSKYKIKKGRINKVLNDEKRINKNSFNNFNRRIAEVKYLLRSFLNLKSKKTVIGYGASTKGNIVLNHCEVKKKQISEVCDGSYRKLSRYTPGSNLKIISKESMRIKNPDYLLVLIWSFRKEVISQEIKYLKKGGKLIFLLPRFHIVNIDNYKEYLNSDFSNLSFKY